MSDTLTLPTYEVQQRDNGLYVRNMSAKFSIWLGPYETTDDVGDAIAQWVCTEMVVAFPDRRPA